MRVQMALQFLRLLHERWVVFRLHAGQFSGIVLVQERLDLFGLALSTLLSQNSANLINGDDRGLGLFWLGCGLLIIRGCVSGNAVCHTLEAVSQTAHIVNNVQQELHLAHYCHFLS